MKSRVWRDGGGVRRIRKPVADAEIVEDLASMSQTLLTARHKLEDAVRAVKVCEDIIGRVAEASGAKR